MERARPDGSTLKWKLAGLESTLVNPSLPFFIQWEGDVSDHPGVAAVDHPAGAPVLEWVEISVSAEALKERLGDHNLDFRFSEGEPGVRSIGLRTISGPLVIGAQR